MSHCTTFLLSNVTKNKPAPCEYLMFHCQGPFQYPEMSKTIIVV